VALLVFDEQLASARLVSALHDRGLDAQTVGDFAVTGRPDPDVVRGIENSSSIAGGWVLVTMDLTIVEDFSGFDWSLYAIAWIHVPVHMRGAAVERAKADIVHRHAHVIAEQVPGDHHTYTARQHFRHRPSLTSLMRRPG
jgi:hypothetical protein